MHAATTRIDRLLQLLKVAPPERQGSAGGRALAPCFTGGFMGGFMWAAAVMWLMMVLIASPAALAAQAHVQVAFDGPTIQMAVRSPVCAAYEHPNLPMLLIALPPTADARQAHFAMAGEVAPADRSWLESALRAMCTTADHVAFVTASSTRLKAAAPRVQSHASGDGDGDGGGRGRSGRIVSTLVMWFLGPTL